MIKKAKKTKKKRKTAMVVCRDRKEFWTTQKQFWQWVRAGIVVKTGDHPLTGAFSREHEEIILLLSNAVLSLGLPSFSTGYQSVYDWSGHLAPRIGDYYGTRNSPEEADLAAIGSDWSAVGSDLESAIEEIERRQLAAAE